MVTAMSPPCSGCSHHAFLESGAHYSCVAYMGLLVVAVSQAIRCSEHLWGQTLFFQDILNIPACLPITILPTFDTLSLMVAGAGYRTGQHRGQGLPMKIAYNTPLPFLLYSLTWSILISGQNPTVIQAKKDSRTRGSNPQP